MSMRVSMRECMDAYVFVSMRKCMDAYVFVSMRECMDAYVFVSMRECTYEHESNIVVISVYTPVEESCNHVYVELDTKGQLTVGAL